MHICNNRVLVLADDFTGANDAGVCLAEKGMRVDVAFDSRYQGDAQALILNSDSRALPAVAAAQKVSSLLEDAMLRFQPRWTVKKIDSTLRGNIGAELEAMMQTLNCTQSVLAPAFPAAGRVTRGGYCYVNGQRLDETEFASDPKTPVIHADIALLIAQQSNLPCLVVTTRMLAAELSQACNEPRVLIVDASTDDELDIVISAIGQSEHQAMLVGSAGICEALARSLTATQHGPLLAMVGSMSEIAQRQIFALAENPRVECIDIDVDKAFSGDARVDARRIADVLRQSRHCVVSTRPDSDTRKGIDMQCQQRGLTRTEFGEQICRYLAHVVQIALSESQPGALYLSGGDVAIAVAQTLGATGFQITGRVAQCVPYGHFLGSSWQRPVMTKAGGFGSDSTLLEVVNFIEEKMSE